MSLKKVKKVKEDRGFKPADLIIYGLIAVLVAALFIAVFASRDTSPLSGVRVYAGGDVVFEYDFNSKEYKAHGDNVTVTDGEVLKVRVDINGGYNIIEINPSARTAKVAEADCRGQDCVHTPAITDNSGIIYCSPHGLKIEPFDAEHDNTVIM